MSHVDPDRLALLALGEPTENGDRAHLDACGQCRREFDDLRRVVEAATSAESDDANPPAPPPGLWDRIAAEVAASKAAAGEPSHDAPERPPEATAGEPPSEATVVAWPAERARRRGRLATALAVAASVMTVLVLSGIVWQQQQRPAEELIADTSLEALAEVTPGAAQLVAVDERLRLVVEAPDLPDPDGYYALWLIDTDVSGMISLGPLEEGRVYELPAGFDPAAYPVVDVSIEPFDGDPTHSGNSVLRGVLPLES